MTAGNIIDGKAFAENLRSGIAGHVAALKQKHGLIPGLSVVLVGDDPASHVYVRNKGKATVEAGMKSEEFRLPASATQAEVLARVDALNKDPSVHGILVQLPLPKQIDSSAVINAIDPMKDVDGFHVVNVGRLNTGQSSMVPCTPLGSLLMLKHYLGKLEGKRAVVVGRS
ncbi:MAG: bifunctional methylenetetrahydrofolate dehydrogenase/methenyltetrahydrofolate cyclohydrolase, partial [Alphaproteobacteria bacterium]|nr:bifunctional methylenetetrahydrofolate dehydrogenase/methenyltetrahydrofolate cyclohydrolase [Alphaproteobacteria bacterium]